jgi:hypothetical protein
MKVHFFAAIFALGAAPLVAQAPAPQVHTSDIGFSYSLPADWEVVDTKPILPAVQQDVGKTATSEAEKKGVTCTQVALTARHGTPSSVIVVVALPYDCFGQTMTEKDLPDFGSGASEGLKNTFDISNPTYGAYTIGTHGLWIERARGVIKDHPESVYTVETVCSVLKKAAVCWMGMAQNDAALQIFESGVVSLDGEADAPLVPADAFANQPQ